jgi:hypothetical protein
MNKTVNLSDRQLCLLSNSAIQLTHLVEKIASNRIANIAATEFLETLRLISEVNDTILTEVRYNIDVTQVENEIEN